MRDKTSSVYRLQEDRPVIQANNKKLPDWMEQAFDRLSKISVQTKQKDISLYDQINSITNTKSKYSSVDEAVKDMRARTGLDEYLKITANADIAKKASSDDSEKDKQHHPVIKLYIDKYVEQYPGTTVPAIQEAVSGHFRSVQHIANSIGKILQDPTILKFMNEVIAKTQHQNKDHSKSYSEPGDHVATDEDVKHNNDMFASLNPIGRI